jgi:uncharacterized caspase-like protein
MAPPDVRIDAPRDGSVAVSESVRLLAEVTPQGELPITSIRVMINGRPTQATGEGIPLERPASEKVAVDASVVLPAGQSEISVVAANAMATSQPASVRVTRRAHAVLAPSLYVLAVGITRHRESSIDLRFAHADAQAVADALAEQEGGLFRRVERQVLVDEQATRRGILRGLRWLRESVTQRDVAFVSLSGHGKTDDDRTYFFIPHDFELDDLWGTGLRWSELTDTLSTLPCKVVLAKDTCHSGAVTGRRTRAVDLTPAIKELTAAESGVVVMAASTGREVSQEADEWGHGAFCLAIVEGLTGRRTHAEQAQSRLPCDYDGDGVIQLTELDAYVTNRVKELTHGAQHPVTNRGNIPSFPLAVVQ